jgi:hypothetical protein
MILGPAGPEHTIAWRPTDYSEYSIEISAHDVIHSRSDEQEVVLARFTCPYCEAEGDFVVVIRNEKRLVIDCERFQREFAITLASLCPR